MALTCRFEVWGFGGPSADAGKGVPKNCGISVQFWIPRNFYFHGLTLLISTGLEAVKCWQSLAWDLDTAIKVV